MKENIGTYYRRVLDSIPIMIFIVDEDVRCIDLNTTAESSLCLERFQILSQRLGDFLHCLNSKESPQGCGRGESCKSCVIRESVKQSRQGNSVVRKRTLFESEAEGSTKKMELLITANAMALDDRLLTILVIEDISELTKLRDIVPICAKCKRVRNDKQFWQSVEHYFTEYRGVDFTHGLCPKCLKETYPDYHGEYDHLIGKDGD